jgi:hypothetical protein
MIKAFAASVCTVADHAPLAEFTPGWRSRMSALRLFFNRRAKQLADYLRAGFGAQQLERLYSGSTGQVELSPEMLDRVIVDLLASKQGQKDLSKELRKAELKFQNSQERVAGELLAAQQNFVRSAQ